MKALLCTATLIVLSCISNVALGQCASGSCSPSMSLRSQFAAPRYAAPRYYSSAPQYYEYRRQPVMRVYSEVVPSRRQVNTSPRVVRMYDFDRLPPGITLPRRLPSYR